MTEYSIEQQVEDIREVMNKAAESKESALKFLIEAGIIEPESFPAIPQSCDEDKRP